MRMETGRQKNDEKKKSCMRVGTGRQKNDESDNNNNEACIVHGVCECYGSCVWKNMKVVEITMYNKRGEVQIS